MAITCPYCQHRVNLKDAKPGRYQPKCPKCARKFALTVPNDSSQAAVVTAIADAAALEETVVPATAVHLPAESPEPGATGAWAATSHGAETTAAHLPSPAASAATSRASVTRASGDVESTVPHATGAATRHGAAAVTAAATAAGSVPSAPPDGVPAALGGYQVIKELGRGGMGSVYLARQISLDRYVALKVMQPQWAGDPVFVSRFTREAYAAAQLVHHNVVQIYDIGRERDVHYFSMEFVQGQTLKDLVKRDGKLDVELAVGYTLQAARGLKFAHDQGMIHRDVKPDNLLLNDQGIVKVADLGLVKTPASVEAETSGRTVAAPAAQSGSSKISQAATTDITLANVAMGTPAYMSPEQSQDAARVDQRADIYSLGCTLYVLLTGRPPFEGTTAFEVMSKHKTEPMVPPEVLVGRVPKELSGIILKMTAKRPEDRYANLAECISALEKFLGVATSGPFTPREEHAQKLEECVNRFNASPAARLRTQTVLGFLGASALIALVCGLIGVPLLAIGFLELGALTLFAFFVISGQIDKSHLFLKFRELVLGNSWADWMSWAVGGLLVVTLLAVFSASLLWMTVAFAVLAVLLALGLQFTINRKVALQRQGPVQEIEQMLRSMRLQGLEEQALRQFVCKYSGQQWEAFYEALFGFDAKIEARQQWGRGDSGKTRQKSGAWREPLLAWIDGKQRTRQEARQRKHLQKIEEQGLKAAGVGAAEARSRSQRAADAMVDNAVEFKQTLVHSSAAGPSVTPEARRAKIRAMLEAAQTADRAPPTFMEKLARGPVGLVCGAKARFLVGGLLLAGCILWMNQNDLIPGKELQQLATDVQQPIERGSLDTVTSAQAQALASGWLERLEKAEPLNLPVVGRLFESFNPGVAGLVLILSAFAGGLRMALFIIPAAAVALVGHWLFPPSLGPLAANQASMLLGAGLGVAGLILGRSTK